MKYVYSYHFPFGQLWIGEMHQTITDISIHPINGELKETSLIKQCHQELSDYFQNNRQSFTFPISYEDTPFRMQCFKALQKIPYGKTISYEDLAIEIGNKKACRAVGQAIHHNPLLIVVPCHRVIQKNGAIGGFGAGVDLKRILLDIEGGTL